MMKLTIEEALKKGVEAHRLGDLHEADRFYTAILGYEPSHSDANHNLGLIAIEMARPEQALSLFAVAIDSNPSVEQYHLSYINALISLGQMDDARAAVKVAKDRGFEGEGFAQLGEII